MYTYHHRPDNAPNPWLVKRDGTPIITFPTLEAARRLIGDDRKGHGHG